MDNGRIRSIVVDRTFVNGNRRWIIDYKTRTHEGGAREQFLNNEQERYRAQLEICVRVIQFIDSRSVFLGLYFPMLPGWREWRFEGPLG